MIEFAENGSGGTNIKVIGIGGGGCNAINNMVDRGLKGVDLIAINTDMQALGFSKTEFTIQIGKEITGGGGAGSLPEVGKKSAEEDLDEIKDAVKDSDMVFVTCGMGGGTGTGASPVVAKVAQDMGALVVGIVTTPFRWEGPKRELYAQDGIAELRKYIDALIVIPNEKLNQAADRNMKFSDAYQKVDEILYNATRGIAEIITEHGYINVDFADVKTVMKGMGDAIMGIGTATGENRAVEATENALNSPLLDNVSIRGAQYALINITAGNDLGFQEVDEVLSKLNEYAGDNLNVIHGVVVKSEPCEEIMVTVVATGFQKKVEQKEKQAQHKPINTIKPATFQDLLKNINSTNNDNSIKTNVMDDNAKKVSAMTGAGKNIPPEISSPKGSENLRNLDKPTFTRKAIKYGSNSTMDVEELPIISTAEETASKYTIDNSQSKVNSETVKQEHNEIAMENTNSNKPAFLRRIMD